MKLIMLIEQKKNKINYDDNKKTRNNASCNLKITNAIRNE